MYITCASHVCPRREQFNICHSRQGNNYNFPSTIILSSKLWTFLNLKNCSCADAVKNLQGRETCRGKIVVWASLRIISKVGKAMFSGSVVIIGCNWLIAVANILAYYLFLLCVYCSLCKGLMN